MATITAVSDATFHDDVKKSELPVLVDFWAEWCGPCRTVAPILEELSKEFEGQLKVVKLDVENNPGVAQAYNIRGIQRFFSSRMGKSPTSGSAPSRSTSSRLGCPKPSLKRRLY